MKSVAKFRLVVSAVALLVLAMATLPCFAGELAVLRNGFSIRHERREVVGDTTRLYVSADGSSFVDVPTDQIEHFEAAPALPDSESRPTSGSELVAGRKSQPPLLAKYARNGAPTSPAPNLSFAPGASLAPRAPFGSSSAIDLNEVISAASGRHHLDPDLVNSVIMAESGFQVRAVSPKGARGLMQLMPGTASQLGVPNAFDPQANVEGGTKYLRELLERYNFDLVKALAAYNAGPHRVEQFGGVPPYYETRVYVARIVRDFNKKKAKQLKAATAQRSSRKIENHLSTGNTPGAIPRARRSWFRNDPANSR